MSKTVDERVVSMQFDNKHFESNVSTTMSTLDKLKQKLKFTDSSRGLDNLNKSVRNVDMSGLGTAVDTVRTRFSALEVMGVTALANITNSAVNAGKRMVSALTIDPVKTGFSEYETKINSIQTIMSNTASKGTTMEDVTRVIDELNTYADKTIYNFAEMTRNIGTFTAAGVGLEESAAAIQGIANLAAASGSTSQQASTAMYQLSQALASGTVKLMDWNSVVNAGMGGEKFQEALKATARDHGVAVDSMIEKAGSFRDSLKDEWLSAEILNETLNKFTVDGAKNYAKSMVDAGKWTQEQADALVKEAESMEDAATKVKTFTQLWDTLKESAQSGWGKTWELIFGDFEEAKELFSGLSDFLGGFINKMSDARNFIVEGVMNIADPWKRIMEKLDGAGLGGIKKITDGVSEAAKKLEYFQDIVNKVWHGDYRNADTGRYELLDADGYDHRVVQSLVNLGIGYKLTAEDVAKAHEQFGITLSTATEETQTAADVLANLSDEQLRNAGLTDDEIKLYRDLAEEAERTGVSIGELVDKMSKKDGRTLLIESFKNAGNGLVGIFTVLKNAWNEIFPAPSIVRIYNIIAAINEFSEKLVLVDKETGELTDTAKKFQRIFKGVFALVDIVATILGGAFRIAFKAASALLGMFGMDVIDVVAYIADAIVKFRDWIDSLLDFTAIFEKIAPVVKKVAGAIGDWIGDLKESDNIPRDILLGIAKGIQAGAGYLGSALTNLGKFLWDKLDGILSSFGVDTSGFTSALSDTINRFKEWIAQLKESDNVPRDIILGLVKGLGEGVKMVTDAAVKLGKYLLDAIKDFLGIHSPATTFIEVAKYCILGLVEGFKAGAIWVWDAVKTIANKCLDIIREIDLGAVLTVAMVAGLLVVGNKIGNALQSFAAPFEGVGDVLDATSKTMKSFSTVVKAHALMTIAKALAVLAGSVVVLSFIEPAKLWGAIGAIAALAVILGGLSAVMGKFGAAGDEKFDFAKISLIFISISAALLLMSMALKKMGNMDKGAFEQGMLGVLALGLMIEVLIATSKYADKGVDGLGATMLKISAALILMAIVVKILGKMDTATLIKGGATILAFVGIIALLTLITKISGKDFDALGSTLIKMSAAMLIMTMVVKRLGQMDTATLIKGGASILAFVGIIALMTLVTKIAGGKLIGDIGDTIIKFSAALLLMTAVVAILGTMENETLIRGGIAILAFVGIIALMTLITKLVGKNDMDKLGKTLISMAVAIGIMAGAAALLGLMDITTLAKGVGAVAILTGMMALMIFATKNAQSCMGNLIVMTVAIALLATSVGILSQIDGIKLASATGAIAVLMGMFALLALATSNIKSSVGVLIVLTIAVGMLGGIVYLLAGLPVENVIGSAIALSGLMLAMSGVLAILSVIGKKASSALLGVITLTALAIPLLAFVGVLAIMSNIQNAMQNAVALGTFVAVMTIVLSGLTIIGNFAASALLGVVSLLALAIPLLAFVGILALMENIQNASENVKLLTDFMVLMTGVLVVLALVGPLAMTGIGAMLALEGVMISIGALAVAIGALMEKFPAIQSFLDTGLPVLEQLATSIGTIIGNIVGAFLESVSNSLPTIGTNLSMFMTNIQGFIEGAKNIDGAVLAGIGYLSGAILAITAVDLLAGIASFIQGGSTFAQLGADLSAFMLNATPFIAGAAMLKPEMLTGVKALAETILILTAANVIEGLTSWLTGGSSLETFGAQLPALGANLSSFAASLGTFDESKVTTIKCAADSIKVLAEAAESLPNEGGWLGKIVGDNSIETFGGYLPGLGTNLSSFASNLGTFDESKVTTITCAADAIKVMAEAAESLPNEGGWLAKIVGDNSIETFGGYLPGLATNLSSFASNLGTFDESKVATVSCAADAIKVMAEAAEVLPNEGGWLSKIVGDNSIETFGGYLPGLGTNLSSFASNLGTFSDDQVATVTCAANAIKAMAEAADSLPNEGGWLAKIVGDNSIETFGGYLPGLGTNLSSFASNLGTFSDDQVATVNAAVKAINAFAGLSDVDGKAIKDVMVTVGDELWYFADDIASFAGKMSEVEISSLASISTKINKLIEILEKTAGVDASAANNFKNALKTLGESGVNSFVDSLTSSKTIASLTSAGTKMIRAANKGASDEVINFKKSMQKSAESVVKAVTNELKSLQKTFSAAATSAAATLGNITNYTRFYSAGQYLADGFAAGIEANDYKAEAKARAMAKAAAEAAEDELRIESPSKVTYGIGNFFGLGFVNAVGDSARSAYKAGSNMAASAREGLSNAIGKVADFLNSDMDTQPTIRPVLDLSNVETGISAMNGMLALNPSVGLMANVGSINTMMNRRSQNGANDDVVSAIDKLRKDVGSMERNSYNINGISYERGSDVASAIETIVRAATKERRT